MTSSAPRVSVIIPTYNRCDYIAETIESILAQDYPAIDVTVVNDGSSDATVDVLKRFGTKIDVITQPNAGQGSAVNRGLAAARGDYMTLVSDDDPILAGAVSRLVDVLETNLHALVAYPDWFIIDPAGERTERIRQFDYSLVHMVRHHLCHPGPCALIRRRALELVGGWDLRWRWVADYDFWLRIALLGPMIHIAEPLATWRRHPNAATLAAPRLAMAKEQVAVIESFFERTDLPAEVRAVETEAIASAWIVAFTVAMDHFEAPGLPRFLVEDRFAGYVETPIPVARVRVGTPLEVASRQVAELTHQLQLSTNDRTSLLRRVEVLQRHLSVRGVDETDDVSDV